MASRRTALVTGGAGFVGAHLAALLCRKGWRVIVIDDLSTGSPSNLEFLGARVELIVGDIADPDVFSLQQGNSVDAIFHLAGQANVPKSVSEPSQDFRTNVIGTFNVLEYARQHHVGKLVFASTVSVYTPDAQLPIVEEAPTHASSPYGAAKAAGENYCFAYAASYQLNASVVRMFNVFGPLMNKYVIHDLTRKLQLDPRQLVILGDGNQQRDYIYVDDAVRALLLVAERGAMGEVYNLGSGVPMRIADLAYHIAQAMGLQNVELVFTNESWSGDIKAWYADTGKLSALGFEPQVGWAQGLTNTIEYLLHHPAVSS